MKPKLKLTLTLVFVQTESEKEMDSIHNILISINGIKIFVFL